MTGGQCIERKCMVRTALLTALVILLMLSLITFVLINDARAEMAVGLQEAIGIALRDNPGIRAFDNSVLAGKEDVGIARSLLLPTVTFEERFLRTDNPTLAFSSKLNQERFTQADFAVGSLNNPSDINDFQTSFSFEQPVFAKEAYVRLDMAKAEAGALGLDYERKKEAVALEVTKAYLHVGTAAEYIKAAELGVKDAEEHRRLSRAKFDSGLGLYSDVLRAESSLKEAEERLITARKNHKVAKRALGLLLGLDGPVDTKDEVSAEPVLDIDIYTSAALGRSDIKALERRRENAENSISLAKAAYYPTVGVGGSYQWNDHESAFSGEGESYRLMAFLRWNLFDGTRREHEKAKARYRAREASARLDGMRKAVLFKVHEAYLGVEEARKSLELARARRQAAMEGTRLVRARYENSLSTIADLLDAQAQLDAARAGVIEKENSCRVALSELKFQSGLILKGSSY
jgi:outer membrane protein